MNYVWVILFVVLGGVAVALQAKIMGNVNEKMGSLENIILTYFTGCVISLIVFVGIGFSRLYYFNWSSTLSNLLKLKWWEISGGGFLGLVIVGSIGFGASRLGTITTLVIIIFSQVLIGSIVDHYGLLGGKIYPINITKIVALVIIGLGVIVLIKS